MARVFLLSKSGLFGEGVSCLLRRQAEVELVGEAADADSAVAAICRLNPDAVIVESGDPGIIIARLLTAGVKTRVIGLDLDSNTLIVYREVQYTVRQVEDLMTAIQVGETEQLENASTRTVERLAGEPTYRAVLYKILACCATPRSQAELEATILGYPEMKTAILSPHILTSWLEQSGAIEKVSIEKETLWQTTTAGSRVLERYAPAKRLLELFGNEPRYRDLFIQVLEFCVTPRTRAEIEKSLQGNLILEEPKVYPSFLIQSLEAADGLEWDGKWRTTEAGKGVVG